MNFPRLLGALQTYAVQRVLTAGLVFGSSILCARLGGPEVYGELAFFLFMVKALLIGNFGSVSGFILNHYSHTSLPNGASLFVKTYTIHLLVLAMMLLLLSPWLGRTYLFIAVAFALITPLYATEPIFRVQRVFHVSLLPDIVLSTSALVAVIMLLTLSTSWESIGVVPSIFFIVIPVMLTILPLVGRGALRQFFWNVRLPHPLEWRQYNRTILRGLPRFAATGALTIFIATDRFFIEKYYSASELGVYMLAAQLSTGAGLLVSAQNMVSGIDIGEAIQQGKTGTDLLERILKQSLTLSIIGFMAIAPLSWLLETYFLTGYEGLFNLTTFLSVGWLAYSSIGNLTEITFYKNAHRPIVWGLFFIVILCIAVNAANIKIWHQGPGILAFSTGLLLLAYSLFAWTYTRQLFLRSGS